MYTVYILHSLSKDKFYVGHTANLDDRLNRHNSGRSKATESGVPWEIVFTQHFQTKSEAYQFEIKIKKQKSKKYIQKIIQGSIAS